MLLMVSVLGGLLGFLRFNTYPARIFMGDAGSQFLGHYLAVAAILLTDSTRTLYSPLVALFIWGVPLLDTVGVMGQRLLEGRSPFVGDRNHIHHKLLASGLTHGQAVTAIYLVHGVMVSCAYVLRWQSDAVLLGVYLLCAAAILSMFIRKPDQVVPVTAPAERVGSVQTGSRSLPLPIGEWALKTLRVAVPAYLIVSVARCRLRRGIVTACASRPDSADRERRAGCGADSGRDHARPLPGEGERSTETAESTRATAQPRT